MLEFRARLRRLLRRPAYVVSVLLSLGLGIAVAVAAFSAVHALVFRALPGVTDRQSLIRIEWASGVPLLTTAEFRAIDAQPAVSMRPLAAQATTPLPLSLPSGNETLSVAFVSGELFAAVGTKPALGRLLTAADAGSAVVISERLWRRAFNGDPGILHSSLTIAARSFPIAGVAPDRFSGLRIIDAGGRDTDYPDAWLPLRDAALWPATARTEIPWLSVAGRLAPGSTIAAARAEAGVMAGLVPEKSRPGAERRTFRVYRSGLDWRDEPVQSLLTLGLFLFVPLAVLAIGCVNVINLQLARALEEAGELSLRLALGASRWRLLRLQILEVATVAALAALLGCAGAHVLLLRAGAVSPVPIGIDPAAAAFAILLVAGVIGLAGVLPAWWTSRDAAAAGLRELRGASVARARLRGALVVVQVAASVMLLALSGLAMRSLATRAPAAGADARHIVVADFELVAAQNGARGGAFMPAILDRLRDAPSIHAAAFSTFTITPGVVRYRTNEAASQEKIAFGGFVTPRWFEATGVRFLAGQVPADFPPGAIVVTRAMASVLTDARPESVVGMPLRAGAGASGTIAGVIEDTHMGVDGRPLPVIVLPMPASVPAASLLVRAGDLAGARQSVREAVTAADPTMPLLRLPTLEERIDESSNGLRQLVVAAATFGLLSVVLAGAGLHSLMSYAVRRRRHEIGVRVALGARSHQIVRLAVGPALRLVSIGAGAGMLLAVPIAALIRAVLLGVSPMDPRGLLPSVAILLVAALAGAAGPALQAIRIEPMDALREE